jgi:ABC-type sugar transport system permease subunit
VSDDALRPGLPAQADHELHRPRELHRHARRPRIGLSLFNIAYYAVSNVPLTILTGLGLALMLNRVTGPLAGFFRTAFYVPNLTPAVAIGTLFLLLLNANGLVNQGLELIGINGPSWLNDGAFNPSIGGEKHFELLAVGGVLVTLPMIIVFFLGQRYFIEGIATTGSTGR